MVLLESGGGGYLGRPLLHCRTADYEGWVEATYPTRLRRGIPEGAGADHLEDSAVIRHDF